MVFFSVWATKDTEITLSLTGDNFKTQLQAEYSSKSLKGLEQKKREKQTEDKF